MKIPVEISIVEGSSNLHALGYDAENKHLYAQFSAGGAIYRYFGVEEAAWKLLQASESKGRFLAKCIKPHHEMEKLDAPEEEASGQ